MKLVFVTDLHLISPQDPNREHHTSREFLRKGWRSFRSLIPVIQRESPDLVVCLGDLVDWYSEENVEFAMTLMDELGVPWVMTPGNHDCEPSDGEKRYYSEPEETTARNAWLQQGIPLDNRMLDFGSVGRLVLLDSANSKVPDGTREWLKENMAPQTIVATHVPPDVPEMRRLIIELDSERKLQKYVQSGSPWVFEEGLRGRASHVLCGHLHVPASMQKDGTSMSLLEMAITCSKRSYSATSSAYAMDLRQGHQLKLLRAE